MGVCGWMRCGKGRRKVGEVSGEGSQHAAEGGGGGLEHDLAGVRQVGEVGMAVVVDEHKTCAG